MGFLDNLKKRLNQGVDLASRSYDQVNVFDNNRTFKQRTPTNNYSNVQQLGRIGNKTGAMVGGSVARGVNTIAAQAPQVYNTGRMYAAQFTNNPTAWKNANRDAQKDYDRFGKTGGLFNVGTIYDSEEARRGDLKTGAIKVGGATLGAAAEVVPFARGATLALKAGAPIKSVAPRLIAENTLYGGAGSAGQQLVETGKIDPKRLVKDVAFANALGVAGYGAGRSVSAATNPITRTKATNTIQKNNITNTSAKSDPTWQKLDQRVYKAVENASTSTGKLKQNYLQEARELIRMRNQRAKQLGGEGGYIKVGKDDPLEFLKQKAKDPIFGKDGKAWQDYNKRYSGLDMKTAKTQAEFDGVANADPKYFDKTPDAKRLRDVIAGDKKVGYVDNMGYDELFAKKAKEAGLYTREMNGVTVAGKNKADVDRYVTKGKSLSKQEEHDLIGYKPERFQPQPPKSPLTVEKNQPEIDVPAPQPTVKRSQLSGKALSMPNRELQIATRIKDDTVNEYADLLKSIDDQASGGNMVKNFDTGGYKRTSDHSDFYREYFAQTGRKPSQAAFREEARKQLESGKAMSEFQEMYNKSNDPEFISLASSQPGKELSPYELNKQSAKALSQEVRSFKDTLTPVSQRSNESNVPVRKLTQQGDTVTATNVNPNVKAGEKRYSIDQDGNFIEDRKGAYRIFTDDEGVLTNIRIGDEVYSAKEIGDLTNIRNYGSTVATQRRNIERAFKNNPQAGARINELVVDYQQQQATKMIVRHAEMKAGMEAIAKDLGISFAKNRGKAKKISAAIQDYGEGLKTRIDLANEFGEPLATKIANADNWFRQQYNSLLDEMNTTLTKYGYDPVPKRKDYYTHFSEPTLFQRFGLKMQEINDAVGTPLQEANPTGVRGKISNELAGQSEYMTPNKQFNPFALRRTGEQRTADAFKAFEKYLNPTLNNIYMTPAITRARVISEAIAMENDRIGGNANQVVTQMREWANHLAGKSQGLDRWMVDRTGFRQALQASNWVQRKVGANSIVGNLATAVLQPIVVAQTAGKAGYKNTLLGLMKEASTKVYKDSPINESEFIKRRYTDLTPVTANALDKASNIAGTPLRVIEQTAARTTWHAFYHQALDKGIKGKQAIKYADIETEKTVAGRAIGEKPELYRSRSAGFATQFMLEVNNYIQQVAKEMTPAQAAKTFVAAYGINLLLQEALGRSVGFNPLQAAQDNLETLAEEDKTGGEKTKEIAQRWAGEVVSNVPVVPNVLDVFMDDQDVKKVFGNDTPIGRFGVGSPYGTLYDNTVGKVLDGKPVEAAGFALAPFGYAQGQKTVKGLNAVSQGKITDKDGKTLVEIPQTPGNYVRAGLFGVSSIPEVNQYYGNIGAKKNDQKPVQNQTNSKAAKMGGNTEAPQTSGDEYEMVRKAFTLREGKLNNLEDYDTGAVKNAVKNVNKNFKTELETAGLPTNNLRFDSRLAEDYADFKKNLEGKNELEVQKRTESFYKSTYKNAYLDDYTKSFYDLGDDDMRTQLQSGKVTKEQMDKAIQLDNLLTEKGLQKYPQIGKKLRAELGYGLVGNQTVSKGRSGGRRGRGGSRKKYQFDIPSSFSLLPQKKSIGSVSKLLANARVDV